MNEVAKVNEKEITLNDGRVAIVFKGKGLHAREAMNHFNASEGRYSPADIQRLLMAQCVKIEGVGLTAEDLDELDMSDYMEIMQAFAELNFTASLSSTK